MNGTSGTRLTHLRQMLDHLEWANRRVLAVLEADPEVALGSDALRLFAHVLGSERGWLSRIQGQAGPVVPWPSLSLGQLGQELERNLADLRALLDGVDDDGLGRDVEYETTAGVAHRSALADILTHLMLHGSYHRGQVAWALRHGGAEPVGTDFIVMVRRGVS